VRRSEALAAAEPAVAPEMAIAATQPEAMAVPEMAAAATQPKIEAVVLVAMEPMIRQESAMTEALQREATSEAAIGQGVVMVAESAEVMTMGRAMTAAKGEAVPAIVERPGAAMTAAGVAHADSGPMAVVNMELVGRRRPVTAQHDDRGGAAVTAIIRDHIRSGWSRGRGQQREQGGDPSTAG
jgi:hypothetical protein